LKIFPLSIFLSQAEKLLALDTLQSQHAAQAAILRGILRAESFQWDQQDDANNAGIEVARKMWQQYAHQDLFARCLLVVVRPDVIVVESS
jgi:hypothetical protein